MEVSRELMEEGWRTRGNKWRKYGGLAGINGGRMEDSREQMKEGWRTRGKKWRKDKREQKTVSHTDHGGEVLEPIK
jgi:hypothetical protein